MTTWYLMDATHPGFAAALAEMESDHESRITANFTYITNLAGDRVFAKVVQANPGNYDAPPILSTYDSTTQHQSPPLTRRWEWEEVNTTGTIRPTAHTEPYADDVNIDSSGTGGTIGNMYDSDADAATSFATFTLGAIGGDGRASIGFHNLGLSIPDDQGMTGFKVIFSLREGSAVGSTIEEVQLLGPFGNVIGTAKTPGTALNTTINPYPFGGENDTWGFDPVELSNITMNAAKFGVRIKFGVPEDESVDVRIYDVQIQVWYDRNSQVKRTDEIWYNRHKVSSLFDASETERCVFVTNGNSNWQFGGNGYDGELAEALFTRFGRWGTGVVTGMSFSGDNQGKTWASMSHPVTALPQDGSPPAGWTDKFTTGIANFAQTGFTHFAALTTVDWTGGYAGIQLQPTWPEFAKQHRLHIFTWDFGLAGDAGGVGKIYPAWRYGDTTSRTELTVISNSGGAAGVVEHTRDFTAVSGATKSGVQAGAKCPGFTANIHTGPIIWGPQYLSIPSNTTGFAWMTQAAWGGHSLKDQILIWLGGTLVGGGSVPGLTTAQKRQLLTIYKNMGAGKVAFWVHESLNSRNDATLSVGSYPATGNTAEGYADNLFAYVSDIQSHWSALGFDAGDLYFVFSRDHADTASDGPQVIFGTAMKQVSDMVDNSAVVDFSVAVPRSVLLANNWYDGGGSGSEHLAQAAYAYAGTTTFDEALT